jgi:diadenosine tetraphosphate (Ap4A) HIT family hydrolase
MSRDLLIKKTVQYLHQLPEKELQELTDFAEFLVKKNDDAIINEGIQKIASASSVFSFLKDEPDLYTVEDLKENYK